MGTTHFEIKHIPLKRCFDVFFSLTAILVGMPIFFVIGFLIKATSKGSIFYSQKRIGRGGKTFNCYKFRTMYEDADQRLKYLLESQPHMRKEWEETRKLKKDPRVTKFGTFLRKTSLDELPQFWNVLKGDLSIVGPRAVVQEEIEQHFKQDASIILKIRPGITGLWQVSGRSDLSYPKRVQLDKQYVYGWSFLLDLKIIARTIPAVLFSRGAY